MAKAEGGDRQPAQLVWEGDSRDVARTFPKEVRKQLGEDIERARRGVKPKSYRPMPSIGPGVAELKQRDEAGWYRTIYPGGRRGQAARPALVREEVSQDAEEESRRRHSAS